MIVMTDHEQEFIQNQIGYTFKNPDLLQQAFTRRSYAKAFGILDSETLKIEVADPSRPGVIRPADDNPEDEVLMLLMPMRVED